MQHFFGMTLLLDAAVKGTVVLLAATLLAVLMRRASAANRHLIWLLAVIAVLLLPIIKLASPLQLAVLPQMRSPIVQTEGAGAAQERAETATPNAVSSVRPSDKQADQLSSPASPSLEATVSEPATPWTVRVLRWLAFAWLAVAGVLLLRLVAGFVLVRWFALRAYPLYEEGWAELNASLSSLAGLRRSVQLYASPHVATPMTWGISRPVIMLPSAAEDWSDERRRVVILHELAHIRRRDSLTHTCALIACALYWFHPLVWKAAARMRAEAERACDDLVLRAGTKASVYADHLLELIRTIGGMRTPSLALPMAQRSTFEGRLLAILEPHLDRTTPRPVSVAGLVVIVGLIVFPLAGLTTASGLGKQAAVAGEANEATGLITTGADSSTENDVSARVMRSVNEGVRVDRPQSAQLEKFTDGLASLAAGAAGTVITGLTGQAGNGKNQLSQRAASSLTRALSDTDVEVRLAAAQSLGQLEDSIAVAALSNALRNDTDARVRKMAAWALGNIESAAGTPALLYALKSDREVEVRRTAVWALGQIEDRAAVPALSEATRDGDAEVRSLAVWALGQIEDKSAVPALLGVLKNGDVEARRQAAWALGQIEDASAVSGLAAALHDSDAQVREQSVWALGQIESPQAVGPLSDLLNDPSPETRKQVAWALGQIEDAGAVPSLSVLLRDDKSTDVRQTAAWALGQVESSAGVPALTAALKDPSPAVRNRAAWALGQIESRPAPQALLDALKDTDKEVRSMAAWALSQIEDPNSAAALRAALKDTDPSVRQAVLNALLALGDQLGYETLAEMLKDADPEVRRAAAAAMGGKHFSNPNPQPLPMPQPRPQPRPQPIR